MANEEIIIQILFITMGMVAVGMILNKIMGLNPEVMKEMREKALNVQERMKTAQLTGDGQQMMELQRESMQITKEMMKKQLIPTCIRCFIFIGIFAVIGFIYADYASGLLPFPILFFGDGWVAIYFLFSIALTLLIYGIKKLYKKYTGKEDPRKKAREITGMLSPTSDYSGSSFQLTRPLPSHSEIIQEGQSQKSEREDSWKDRIKN